MAKPQNNESQEELSPKTLELMLFREMITNGEFLGRFSNVVDYRWFRTPHIRFMAEIAVLYYRKYGGTITKDYMESIINRRNETQVVEANKIDLNASLYDFNKAKDLDLGASVDEKTKMGKIQKYVKQEALRNALLDSASNLEKSNTDNLVGDTLNKFEEIQKILFEEIDFGYEFSNEGIDDAIDEHIKYLTNPDAKISSGWDCFDNMTSGGFLKDGKSLYVFMAQAGLGKSNVLANIGYNFLCQGLKVLVLSMEMSKDVYMRRFDSIMSKIDIDDLVVPTLSEKLREKTLKFYKVEHPTARLNIKEFPPNSISSRDMEQYIDKMIEVKGYKPDAIIVDYLGLVNPNSSNKKGDSSMYQDGSIVSKELRALSYKYSVPVITAVQCNSSGFDTADIGMGNIAESRAIAHNADFIGGLYQTEDEQADGIFHMKILKNRFGDKSSLKFMFNKDTMEFTDINDVEQVKNDKAIVDSTTSGNMSSQTSPIDEFDKELFGELGMP